MRSVVARPMPIKPRQSVTDTTEVRTYRALVEIPAPPAQDPSCVSSTRHDVFRVTYPFCVAKKKHSPFNKGRMILHTGSPIPPFIHILPPPAMARKREDTTQVTDNTRIIRKVARLELHSTRADHESVRSQKTTQALCKDSRITIHIQT